MDALQRTDTYRKLERKLARKSTRRRALRYAIVAGNTLLLAGVVGFVLLGQRSDAASAPLASTAPVTAAAAPALNPLDQLSSADIAVNVARMAGLPEATAVVNQADSVNAELTMTPTSTSIVAKPQVVVAATLLSRKDIHTYIVRPGDTVASVAAAFGITSDSVRWSNSLAGNTLATGQKLVLPPQTGIVYTVKAGDTIDSLAQKFKASKDQLIAVNDAEISGIHAGEQIFIPNGSKPAPQAVYAGSYGGGFAWGTAPIYGYNGYDYGYCTWYVANRIAVPSNWGNASTWAYYAALSGWTVSSHPVVGAIAQTPYAAGGEGHVAIVEAVSPDGSQIKFSDMNGLAGWGRIGYSGWTPASLFPHYIYR